MQRAFIPVFLTILLLATSGRDLIAGETDVTKILRDCKHEVHMVSTTFLDVSALNIHRVLTLCEFQENIPSYFERAPTHLCSPQNRMCFRQMVTGTDLE